MNKKSSKAKKEEDKSSGTEMKKMCSEKEAQIFRRKGEVAGRERHRRMCRKSREAQTDT